MLANSIQLKEKFSLRRSLKRLHASTLARGVSQRSPFESRGPNEEDLQTMAEGS